jgi:hypothetical protein
MLTSAVVLPRMIEVIMWIAATRIMSYPAYAPSHSAIGSEQPFDAHFN